MAARPLAVHSTTALGCSVLLAVLALLVASSTAYAFDLNVAGTCVAFLIVATFTVPGKSVLWRLRPDTDHVVSA